VSCENFDFDLCGFVKVYFADFVIYFRAFHFDKTSISSRVKPVISHISSIDIPFIVLYDGLRLPKKMFVVIMVTNPEPGNSITV